MTFSCLDMIINMYVVFDKIHTNYCSHASVYNAVNVYCRELAPGTVSLTGDRAQGDDNKHWAYYSFSTF